MNDTEEINTERNFPSNFSPHAWLPLAGLLWMALITSLLLQYVVNIYVVAAKPLTFSTLAACLTWSISVLLFAVSILITYAITFQVIKEELQSTKLLIGGLALFTTVGVIIWKWLPGGQELVFNKDLLGKIYNKAPHAETFVTSVHLLARRLWLH